MMVVSMSFFHATSLSWTYRDQQLLLQTATFDCQQQFVLWFAWKWTAQLLDQRFPQCRWHSWLCHLEL